MGPIREREREKERGVQLTSMEVVVSRQRIGRHVDVGLVALETRVAEVTDRLNLCSFSQQHSMHSTLAPTDN